MTRPRSFHVAGLVAGIALLVILLRAVQPAAARWQPHEPDMEVYNRTLASTLPKQDVTALVSQAQTKGTVRVIVGLRVGFQPEGKLANPRALQTQRAAIERAQNTLLSMMSSHKIESVKRFAFIPYMAMEADAAALNYLASSAIVTSIREDKVRRPQLMESVPLIGAPAAWASGSTGAGQTVAILDTGVDKTHPFLVGKVISEACFSTTSVADGATSLCPGGVSQSTAPGSGLNCDTSSIPDCFHGTHVAGIAAGRDDGSIGFSGVAKDAWLVAIQIFSRFDGTAYCGASTPCVLAYDSDILSGLQRVQTLSGGLNIAAANLSLGGEAYTSSAACEAKYPEYRAAIDNLRSLGIATVIASGNEYYSSAIDAPACISTAISVGSTQDGSWWTTTDAVSSFSNSASFLSVLAPGETIYSSTPNGGYALSYGTSMATPHVTGAWAVLKSRAPGASVTEILSALTTTGQPITDPRNGITKSRIQVDMAAATFPALSHLYLPLILK